MRRSYLLTTLFIALLVSCGGDSSDENTPTENNQNNNNNDSWTIPVSEITGSDNPFPFADNPNMQTVQEIEGLNDNDQLILVSFESQVKAYPLKFIAPFEVVNDVLDGVAFSISYCPVTESTVCTENRQGNNVTSQVASGYRQNENVIVKDINSDSYWTQMLIRYVKGPYVSQSPKTLPMIETNWQIVKTYFPDALVFASNSISSKTSSTIAKSADFGEDERVYGILNESEINDTSISVIGFANFDHNISTFDQIIGTKSIRVFGSDKYNFITAFETEISESFTPVQNKFPVIMKDPSGSEYNVFGIAVNGTNMGRQLTAPKSYLASWWAWKKFYRNFQDL